MKYFVRGWFIDSEKADKIMKEYNGYYRTIENQLSDSTKNLLRHRHDTHIVRAHFIGKDYVMELDKKIWGQVKFVFYNAKVQLNDGDKIKNECWLYDEIYKLQNKIEIHILFVAVDAIITCDDAGVSIEEKEYFEELYKKEDYTMDLSQTTKTSIQNAIINKAMTCGNEKLKSWEKLIYSFLEIYSHINYYKNNTIEEKVEGHYSYSSKKEKEEIYKFLFDDLEKKITNHANTLKKYEDIIKINNFNYMVNKLIETYSSGNTPMEQKSFTYLVINEEILNQVDFKQIYKRILDCIDKGLIK